MAADLPAYLWPAASYGLIESRALSGSSLKQYSSALPTVDEEREWVQSGYRSAHYFTPDNSILSSAGLASPLPSTSLHNHAIHSARVSSTLPIFGTVLVLVVIRPVIRVYA